MLTATLCATTPGIRTFIIAPLSAAIRASILCAYINASQNSRSASTRVSFIYTIDAVCDIHRPTLHYASFSAAICRRICCWQHHRGIFHDGSMGGDSIFFISHDLNANVFGCAFDIRFGPCARMCLYKNVCDHHDVFVQDV